MQVNIHEAKTNLSRLIEKAESGEVIIISRAGKPVARLTAIDSDRPKRKPGLLKGRIRVSKDFDAPLPESILAEFEGSA